MLLKFDKILNKIRSKLIKDWKLILDNGNINNTILLAGVGRSGTTWLQEIINRRNEYRVMFEPFDSRKIDLISDWNYRQYLRPSDNNRNYLEPAKKILSGNITHKWIDQFNNRVFIHKRLIKDIRINLMLKWIKTFFPEIPIILILRHPCAVISSKLRLGWPPYFDEIIEQDELINDHFPSFEAEFKKKKSILEKHAFSWCIENYVPLKQFNKDKIHVVFYENILLEPEIELKKIFSFISEKFSTKILIDLNKPSALSRNVSNEINDLDRINKWQKQLSENQIMTVMEICSLFDFNKVYNRNSKPLVRGSEALKLFKNINL